MVRTGILSLLVTLLLAGCGGAAATPTIAMRDMRFRQREVHVAAGQPVTLHVVNEDSYAHAFDIDAFDIHRPLAARESVEITFTPTQPGEFEFYCGSPGHQMAGMSGLLVVEP